MPTAEKAQTIEVLAQKLRESKGAVLLDYRGLNVADITALRRQLAGDEVEFHVAKNTLLRIAAERAEVDVAPELLTGPTAVAFGWRDEVSPAKLLTEFVRRNRVVTVKGGLIGGRTLTAADIGRVAELPSKEVLMATMLGGFQAPASRALAVMQAPAQKLAGLLQALMDKKQTEGAAPAQ
jgi:large subunit ribosomal protein L10